MVDSNPIGPWPRVKTRKDGSVVVSGWYVARTRARYLAWLCKWTVASSGLMFLAMGFLPLLSSVPEGGPLWGGVVLLADLRRAMADAAASQPGALTEWIAADLRNELSMVPLILMTMIAVLTLPISAGISAVLSRLLLGVSCLGFRVVLTRDQVRFRRLLWWKSFDRRRVVVQFMATPFRTRRNVADAQGLHRVHMRYGHRLVPITKPVFVAESEVITTALSHARDLADGQPLARVQAPSTERNIP